MVGYPESLTDPSYSSQILILTYPLIGNYGVPDRPEPTGPTSEDAYNIPPSTHLLDSLPMEFESSHIHVAALVVANYHPSYSHHLANSSLGHWLKEQGIPAVWGVDTRMLTKRLREGGVLLGRVLARRIIANTAVNGESSREKGFLGSAQRLGNGFSGVRPVSTDDKNSAWREDYRAVPFFDPNGSNLVAKVSTRSPRVYSAQEPKQLHKSGRPMRVVAVDVGMKWNQIRCFRKRGIQVKVVPWVNDLLKAIADYRIITSMPSSSLLMVSSYQTGRETLQW